MQRRDHAAIELHPLLPGHGDSRNLTASGSSSVHSAIGFRDRPFATRPKPDAIRDTATAATRAAPRLLDPTSSPPAYAAAWRHWRMEIENWDTFFTEVYAFHRGGGWTAVVMARVFHLITMAFVIGFSTFLFECVDHALIPERQHLREVVREQCLYRLHPLAAIALFLFAVYWTVEAIRFLLSLPALSRIHAFYHHLLGIPDHTVDTLPWNAVVQRIVDLHRATLEACTAAESTVAGAFPRRLSAHDVVNRVMRRENYQVALFNMDVLELRVPLPRIVRALWSSSMGHDSHGDNNEDNTATLESDTSCDTPMLLTQVMEWHLRFGLFDAVFTDTEQGTAVCRDLLRSDTSRARLAANIRRRLRLLAMVNLVLAPFVLGFLVMHHVFKYGEEYHKNPTALSARTYSRLARWKFRHFNELDHAFDLRLNHSHAAAVDYMEQFPQRRLAIVAKLVSFVAGAVALALALFTLMDDEVLLRFHLTEGGSVLWWIGVTGVVYSCARGFVPDPHTVYNPDTLMLAVIDHTHYCPAAWKQHGLHSQTVRRQFSRLFIYRVQVLFQELASVVVAPFVLWFSVDRSAEKVVRFFREFTVHVEGVGNVCSFAVFDFENFNVMRGVIPPTTAAGASASTLAKAMSPAPRRSTVAPSVADTVDSMDKMESSMVEFKRAYPEWEPADPAAVDHLRELVERDSQEHEWQRSRSSSAVSTKTSSPARHQRFRMTGDVAEYEATSNCRTPVFASEWQERGATTFTDDGFKLPGPRRQRDDNSDSWQRQHSRDRRFTPPLSKTPSAENLPPMAIAAGVAATGSAWSSPRGSPQLPVSASSSIMNATPAFLDAREMQGVDQ